VIVHKLTVHPLSILFEHGLPELDIGVMSHGFTEHGRDYFFVIEDCIGVSPGTYRLTFTHVVELEYGTAISPATWSTSWSDEFTDYARWEAAGEPEGYVFGTNWSLAYPGFTIIEDHPNVSLWTEKLQHPMFAASLASDRFKMTFIFHGAHMVKLSDAVSTVSRVIYPL